MGSGGEDIQLSPAARRLVPYQIECKAKAKIAVYAWYDQAKSHGNREPLVFFKEDRKRPLVVMDAEHFIKLLAGQDGRNQSNDPE